eukprot:CAMPEP_0178960668 /NCGR_PEP_ID=MMETSP0789-20121207/13104_1 /TAXON_ID=3005 /ORGANISM="Rhizosolenia setigera, Strain CCMP 1694" /LENGTH=183 /DNA_ID=CAMNT_0020644067 /DNA_START=172 /DNA_END=726 /DNA_ORIENTATION=+
MCYYCPLSRYCSWESQVDVTTSFLAENLGYNQLSWNLEGGTRSDIEMYSFDTFSNDTQNDLGVLFYDGDQHDDEDQHDCCLNHYEWYDWVEFDEEDQEILVALGYDQAAWDNDLVVEDLEKPWKRLPDSVQEAARELCYTEEIWDGWEDGDKPINKWKDDTELPGSYSKSLFVTLAARLKLLP